MLIYMGTFNGFAQINNGLTPPDEMSITVLPDDTAQSEIRTFVTGSCPFLNRSYVWQTVPVEFEGFQFLSTYAGTGVDYVYAGSVLPSKSGFIYLIGPKATVKGWSITDVAVKYSSKPNPGELFIYKKYVIEGKPVKLPVNAMFAGFSPLAKKIILKK